MDLGVHILVIKLEIYHGHQDTILYLLYSNSNREPFIYLFLKLYSFTMWKLEIDRSFKLV